MPEMRQEFGDFAVWVCWQASQNILQVSEGFVAVEFGGLDEAHDGGGAFSSAQTPRK